MRDVDARHAARFEPIDQLVQPIGFGLAQAARRLVEDDDPRAAADRRGDLHHLLLRDRQLAEPARDVELGADLGEHLAARAARIAPRSTNPRRAGSAPRQRFSATRQVVAERELLVHHAHARGERVARAVEAHLACRRTNSVPSSGV